jgi:SAM-dependent methyltransferase
VKTLKGLFPNLSTSRVHESSPSTISSKWIAQHCGEYIGTQYFPNVRPGSFNGATRCENLENLTFADCEFDLVITQDVMEHVLDPARAFREIARILRPGGAHVFTVPIYAGRETRIRARYSEHGGIEHLESPEYHANPIDPKGSLVATEWGNDLPRVIAAQSEMETDRLRFDDSRFGLKGEFLDVLISRKSKK